MYFHRVIVLAACCVFVATEEAPAALVAHFDPSVISTMFQDGNVGGGTVPVTGVGDPVRWITDVSSPTPGGVSLDGFVDLQQAGTGATLVDSPGGTVLSFAGDGNLLGFDDDIGGTIDGTGGALDSNTLTLILVGQANVGGTGIDTFIDFRSDNPAADAIKGFGLQYDHDLGQLQGVVQGDAVAGTSLATGQLFVSALTWNGPASTATLQVTTLPNQMTVTTNDSASDLAIDQDRFRLGRTADSAAASSLDGLIGDLYLYNDVLDHGDVVDRLVQSYSVPEPSSAVLCLLAAWTVAVAVKRVRRCDV